MKTSLLNKLKNNFVKNILILATGTVLAQIVKMSLSPVITRLYSPEAIGIMGVFNSIIQVIIPIAAFTYPRAIVLPKSDFNAKQIMKLSTYLSILMGGFLLLIIFLFYSHISNLLSLNQYAIYIYLIPIVVILNTLMDNYEQWFIRTKKFKINAKSLLYQSIITDGSKVGIGYFYATAPVLLIITACNNGVRALILFLLGRNDFKNNKTKNEERMSIMDVAKKYKDFPLFQAPQMFIDASTRSMPILLLASLFGQASAGFFTICNTVLMLPSTLIGRSIGNVFYPQFNEAAYKKEAVTKLLTKSVFYLSIISIFPFGLIILFGPWLFEFVFGENWVMAGEYARWLSLSSLVRFIIEPCLRALPVLSAQKLHLRITIIQTIIRLSVLIIGFVIFKSDVVAIALYGIVGMLINFYLLFKTLQISKKFDDTRYERK